MLPKNQYHINIFKYVNAFFFFFFNCLFVVTIANAQNVCTTLGQRPETAFPVCGSSVFNQTNVPTCTNRSIVVAPCKSDGYTYYDDNPFWYKFTCFQSGTLSFAIVPVSASDDYDWQLFDVTNKPIQSVYTDESMIVACNWSGRTGTTGANATGTSLFNCGGSGFPTISSMPNLIAGHSYLLMVSNFSASQRGYQLSFSGGTAKITDETPPHVKEIGVNCIADQITVKLNKKMRCNTLAANGSDFRISSSPAIASVRGIGCTSGFDMDSIVIQLQNPLPAGNYTITTATGTDGNTILDNCAVGIPANEVTNFTVKGASLPATLAAVTAEGCKSVKITANLNIPIVCSTLATNGSDFIISGPSPVTITAARAICTNNFATQIELTLSAPMTLSGNYNLAIKTGTDGNTLINECNIPTPVNNNIGFTVFAQPSIAFTQQEKIGCLADTILVQFTPDINTTKWAWYWGNNQSATTQSAQIILQNGENRSLKFWAGNNQCSDSVTKQIAVIDKTIKASIGIIKDTACALNDAVYTDVSLGNIIERRWDFGNGNTSTAQNPPIQSYPLLQDFKTYPVKLWVKNNVGCTDSVTYNRVVKPSFPSSIDTLYFKTCAPDTITVAFDSYMLCSSVVPNGSDFSITGPSQVIIKEAIVNCNAQHQTNIIKLVLQNKLAATGTYTLQLKVGSDGNTLLNDCGVASAPAAVAFFAHGNIKATMLAKFTHGCNQSKFELASADNNNVTNWRWQINGQTIIGPNWELLYNINQVINAKLIVSNAACRDSVSNTYPLVYDSLVAAFDIDSLACPNDTLPIINKSIGKIRSWFWDYGNGQQFNIANPPTANFTAAATERLYTLTLRITDIYNCVSTTTKTVRVVPTCNIAVPTAFTPNSDGKNDFLYALNAFKALNLHFVVMNRFGQTIFETREWTKKWDGTLKGIQQPAGTYVWYLQYTDYNTGQRVFKQGTTVLLR